MIDLDPTLRAAIAESAGAVAPPFATIERRAHLRHVRRAATLAATAVVAVAATALATPHLAGSASVRPLAPTQTPSLRPADDVSKDVEARHRISACLERHRQAGELDDATVPCFTENGFQTPLPQPGRSFCEEPGARSGPVVARGSAGRHEWVVRAALRGEETCVSETVDGVFNGSLAIEVGRPELGISADRLADDGATHWLLLYGTTRSDATTATVTVDGATWPATVVALPGAADAVVWAVAVPVTGETLDAHAVARNASGGEVRTGAIEIPLSRPAR